MKARLLKSKWSGFKAGDIVTILSAVDDEHVYLREFLDGKVPYACEMSDFQIITFKHYKNLCSKTSRKT